ncbi:penicillin-binding protein 2 [Candidatus Parcubacteria bacterium]|nr:penicillin-binding protein 2 [Candidatus Parcubacteria bacterium]
MIARKRKIKKIAAGNRLRLLLTVVFFISGLVAYRLVNLQWLQHDWYTVLASDQHQVFNKLEPKRGQIFMSDIVNENIELFSLAINKDFALVYTVPRDVNDAAGAAEKLYEIFDKENIEIEVEKTLEEDEYFKEINTNKNLSPKDVREKLDFRDIKKELEIKILEEKKINEYLAKLTKRNDPYEPIKRKVDEEDLAKLMDFEFSGINYILEKHRYYPSNEIGSHFLGFVGYDDEEQIGRYGLEGFFNEELSGKRGSILAERSAGGEVMIINDRRYTQPVNGHDLILSINRSIQFFACQKLSESVEQYGADGGTVIVLEPYSGAILAMCSAPDYDPNFYNKIEDVSGYNNPAIFEAYEPGSIFKVFTMAAGIDHGKVKPSTTYLDKGWVQIKGWPKPINNSDYEIYGGHGVVDMVTVLAESLNTGSIFVMEKTGAEIFADYVKKFGFGEKTGIELETEGITNIINLNRNRIRPVEAATASFGQGITATPLQIVSAFGAVANGGILMKPYLVESVVAPDGNEEKTVPHQLWRVIREKSAFLVSGMMVNVIDSGHAKLAGVKGYYVAGKTGTAQVADKKKGGYLEHQTNHTFVGFAPVEDPAFVMITKLDNPKNVKYAASSAAPLFGEIAEFILDYFQIPKER